eukprot:scaffold107962_cov26-Prasinocladus_malaysianus.AAC.1
MDYGPSPDKWIGIWNVFLGYPSPRLFGTRLSISLPDPITMMYYGSMEVPVFATTASADFKTDIEGRRVFGSNLSNVSALKPWLPIDVSSRYDSDKLKRSWARADAGTGTRAALWWETPGP